MATVANGSPHPPFQHPLHVLTESDGGASTNVKEYVCPLYLCDESWDHEVIYKDITRNTVYVVEWTEDKELENPFLLFFIQNSKGSYKSLKRID